MSEEVKQEGEFKLKPKAPKIKGQGNIVADITKIDLSKPQKEETNAIQEQETGTVVDDKQAGDIPKVEEQVREPGEIPKVEIKSEELESPLQIIEDEDDNAEEITMVGGTESPNTSQEQKEVLPQAQTQDYPENVDKLIEFMKETGGTIDDYARLNADYSDVDGGALLKEYYKQAKPHLDSEEIDFVIEDSFSFDEDLDEARDIRKKKLAYKEEVAKAKSYLEETKSKYYDEIKLRPGVTQDQQKATDFFNRYNKQQETAEQQHAQFKESTKNHFGNNFEGFDIKVGDKNYKYNIQNRDKVAENQSNINNLVGKFLDSDGSVKDAKGYHKAMYAADNVDKITAHFYEQGKADAVKEVVNSSKNLSSTKARSTQGDVFINGLKVKAISGADSKSLRIKTKKFN